jgi:hypothetical protein
MIIHNINQCPTGQQNGDQCQGKPPALYAGKPSIQEGMVNIRGPARNTKDCGKLISLMITPLMQEPAPMQN